MDTLFEVASTAKPEKKKVKKSDTVLYINYKNKTYAIQRMELRNLGVNHAGSVVKEAKKLGMDPGGHFFNECLYCGYSSNNIFSMMTGKEECMIISDVSKIQKDCNYKSPLEIKIATVFDNSRDGSQIRAIEDNCAFYDALVKVLHKKKVLDKYKIKHDFNYKPLNYFQTGKADPTPYIVKKPSFLRKLKLKFSH